MFKAWKIHAEGQPRDVMKAEQADLPALGPGEMRVKVAAAALGLPDYFMCTGQYPANPKDGPFTPGGRRGCVCPAAQGGYRGSPSCWGRSQARSR